MHRPPAPKKRPHRAARGTAASSRSGPVLLVVALSAQPGGPERPPLSAPSTVVCARRGSPAPRPHLILVPARVWLLLRTAQCRRCMRPTIMFRNAPAPFKRTVVDSVPLQRCIGCSIRRAHTALLLTAPRQPLVSPLVAPKAIPSQELRDHNKQATTATQLRVRMCISLATCTIIIRPREPRPWLVVPHKPVATQAHRVVTLP